MQRKTIVFALFACLTLLALSASAAPPKSKMSTPVLICGGSTQASLDVTVCAGATGAPAGFSLQWLTADAFAANGEIWLDSSDAGLCKGSFSGNANLSRYILGPNECVTVNIGDFLLDAGASTNCADPLTCGTEYVFRAFSHATNTLMRSEFTGHLSCSTAPCGHDNSCTLTQGYWKTHGPEGCATGNNSNEWPVASLTLGTVEYLDTELCSILNRPAAGNGLLTLAHQLIAAKLNVESGADDSGVAGAIAAADAVIGELVVPPVGSGSLSPGSTSALVTTLSQYNEGAIGPGHCN